MFEPTVKKSGSPLVPIQLQISLALQEIYGMLIEHVQFMSEFVTFFNSLITWVEKEDSLQKKHKLEKVY